MPLPLMRLSGSLGKWILAKFQACVLLLPVVLTALLLEQYKRKVQHTREGEKALKDKLHPQNVEHWRRGGTTFGNKKESFFSANQISIKKLVSFFLLFHLLLFSLYFQ